MNNYTWKIEQLDCFPSAEGQSNVVFNVHWRITGNDGKNEISVYGTQGLTFDAKNAFISYPELTKETVVKWVQDSMGSETVSQLQESLDKQLEALANPLIVTPLLPWETNN
jgi:hypothetical protein